MPRLTVLAICSLTVLCSNLRLSANDAFDEIGKFIRTRMESDAIPSAAVAVARDRRIVWEKGFGFADVENNVPATPHTVYRICSIGKALTGTAIMVLVDRNEIDLDRPVNDYLGKAKLKARIGSAGDARVRRVANHTSGLPTHDQSFFAGEPYQRVPSDGMETLIARYGNIVWPPGERYEYSNIGMGVLGHVVDLQSGSSFADFMQAEVFLPLGMTRSSVRLSNRLQPFAAKPYFNGTKIPHPTTTTAGAGDMWCSTHDLVGFGMFHLKDHLADQKAILSDKAIDEMQIVTTSHSPNSEYGVGWGVDQNYRGTGLRAVGHHGGNIGWHSFLLLLPEKDLSIAVLANAVGNIVDPIVDKAIAALVPDFQQRKVAAAAAKRRTSAQQQKLAKRTHSPKSHSKFVGTLRGHIHTFEGRILTEFRVADDGQAHVQIGQQQAVKMKSLRFTAARLTADLSSDIDTADTQRQPSGILEVDLTLRGEVLNGAIYANSLYGHDEWGGYRLNHWIELKLVR